MRELHSRLAEVNEKYGLERGDDITITGAKHKSTETYRRELADECRTLSNEVGMKKTLLSGLNRSITKAETKIKALQTMVSNLEKAEADKQATIAELEDYMKNHLGDAVEIKAKITATRKELWDVRDKLDDKKMKHLCIPLLYIQGCKAPIHDIENCCSLLYICLWLFKYTKCSAVFFFFYTDFITPFSG